MSRAKPATVEPGATLVWLRGGVPVVVEVFQRRTGAHGMPTVRVRPTTGPVGRAWAVNPDHLFLPLPGEV